MKLSPLTIQGTNILSILEGWKSIETNRSNVRKIKTNKRFVYWSDPEWIPGVKVKVMQHLMTAKEGLENIGKDLNFINIVDHFSTQLYVYQIGVCRRTSFKPCPTDLQLCLTTCNSDLRSCIIGKAFATSDLVIGGIKVFSGPLASLPMQALMSSK